MTTNHFIPHPLLANAHAQTVFAALVSPLVRLKHTQRLWVPLADGDALLLNVQSPAVDDAEKPLVLLMHGLGGSGDGSLIVRQSAKLNRLGYTALRFHHRGCGPGSQARARGLYHSGRTDDIAATLSFIAKTWPGRKCVAIGYSLSGNMLLRLLGQQPRANHAHLQKALAVCPPIDLEACSLALSNRHNKAIDQFFSLMLTRQARARELQRPSGDRRNLEFGLSLRQFDEVYTAPVAGFVSRDDYYTQCSSQSVISSITVPTDILVAADDPIIPVDIFRSKSSSSVLVRIETYGGHMGFYSRDHTSYGDRRWLDAFVLDWILKS